MKECCCVVCAEPLEWLAYGPCGHLEVCSTCTSRLRFILKDKNCCICRQECPSVVVTKALGDYTNSVGDFSTLPAGATEGKVGDYWFHLDTQAYFDDEQHYKMIKAMCRFSCSVCDREFKDIDELGNHLVPVHERFMCDLCLKGGKLFICEQKLYTLAQLERHLSGGDTEVDGNEIERGGFMGHPICYFCRKRFYGDNELCFHMLRHDYTCHICQRRHPENFDYYLNYSALKAHFSQEHFLCENADCLGKMVVVFASEAELKRHNEIEHVGNMSLSQHNAALQNAIYEPMLTASAGNFNSGESPDPVPSLLYKNITAGRERNMNNRFSAANPANSEMFDMQNAIYESMLTASAGNFNSGESPDPGLASLCPDQDRQRELEAHEARLKNLQLAVNQVINQTGEISIRSGSIDNHRKGKTVVGDSSKVVADSGRSLGKPSDEVEVLSKDGYRTAKGKAKPWEIPALNRISGTSGCSEEPADNCQRPPPLTDSLNSYSGEKWTCNACSLLNKPESSLCLVCETERPDGLFMKEPSYGGKGKQKKKASKAQRVNLDDS